MKNLNTPTEPAEEEALRILQGDITDWDSIEQSWKKTFAFRKQNWKDLTICDIFEKYPCTWSANFYKLVNLLVCLKDLIIDKMNLFSG